LLNSPKKYKSVELALFGASRVPFPITSKWLIPYGLGWNGNNLLPISVER
jgi:hypothetical protein